MNNDNYIERLLKKTLQDLLFQTEDSFYCADTKVITVVRNILRLVNDDTKLVSDSKAFTILTYCTLIETANDYDMPFQFQDIARELAEDIKRYIKE